VRTEKSAKRERSAAVSLTTASRAISLPSLARCLQPQDEISTAEALSHGENQLLSKSKRAKILLLFFVSPCLRGETLGPAALRLPRLKGFFHFHAGGAFQHNTAPVTA